VRKAQPNQVGNRASSTRLPVGKRDVPHWRAGSPASDVDWGRVVTVGDPITRPGPGFMKKVGRSVRTDRRGYVDCTGCPAGRKMLDHYASISGAAWTRSTITWNLGPVQSCIVLRGGMGHASCRGMRTNPTMAAFRARLVLDNIGRRRRGVWRETTATRASSRADCSAAQPPERESSRVEDSTPKPRMVGILSGLPVHSPDRWRARGWGQEAICPRVTSCSAIEPRIRGSVRPAT